MCPFLYVYVFILYVYFSLFYLTQKRLRVELCKCICSQTKRCMHLLSIYQSILSIYLHLYRIVSYRNCTLLMLKPCMNNNIYIYIITVTNRTNRIRNRYPNTCVYTHCICTTVKAPNFVCLWISNKTKTKYAVFHLTMPCDNNRTYYRNKLSNLQSTQFNVWQDAKHALNLLLLCVSLSSLELYYILIIPNRKKNPWKR